MHPSSSVYPPVYLKQTSVNLALGADDRGVLFVILYKTLCQVNI